MNRKSITILAISAILLSCIFIPLSIARRGGGGRGGFRGGRGGFRGGFRGRGGFRRGGFRGGRRIAYRGGWRGRGRYGYRGRWGYRRPWRRRWWGYGRRYWGWGWPYWGSYGYYGYPYRRYYSDRYDCNECYPYRYSYYDTPYWWRNKQVWPPKQVITVPEKEKATDDRGKKYWEIFNSTDRKLTFYSDEGTKSTLEPGERAKIMRGKSFGYAIASKSGKLLKDSATRKHFITIFHRGYAADHTNKRQKWATWGEAQKKATPPAKQTISMPAKTGPKAV